MNQVNSVMVDNQMLQSFSDCLDLQLFMQHQQEEKVKENQMFYKYLQNQLQILTTDLENDNIQKQMPKQNKNGITINKTPQSQQRLNRYLEMKSIIDINFKQNISFYIKQRELIKLLKERLYFVNSMIANKRQVYEIDLESQETRILVRDYFELKEDNPELKNNININNNLSDNLNNCDFFSDSFDQSNKAGEDDQDKMDDWIRSFNDKVQNYNLIEVDFGFEDIKQQEQSFVNSLQWIVSGMNGIQLSESNSSNQILEQNQLQNQKQDIFQSSFLQDIENDNQNKYSKENLEPIKLNNQNDSISKNRTQNNKNQIYIEIESKEDIQENEEIEEEEDQVEQEKENKQAVKSKPQTPSKLKEKMSFENGGSRGVITRSASKKLVQISPEQQVKNQSQAQEKANIWNDSCNLQQMDNAIFISNSIEQENSPRKGNTILQKELLEIHSNSSSLNNVQKEQQSKEIQLKKMLKKETINENSQIPQKQVLNNKNEGLQMKKTIQIIKQSDIASSSIKLNNIPPNNSNINLNSQQQKSLLSKVKNEFSQPVPRISSGQGLSVSKTINNDASNKSKQISKQKQDQQMELEKEIIIISPLETNIMSSSGISSQRSPNNSCIIIKQNKIGKRIIKEDKNSPNSHISRDNHKISSNGSANNQAKQKIQKRKIVKS
ncbi:hypothetical protein TTHERM_00616290 (macronuclear) [Tetrahymena thermophila SB210]|uniref:Uncharacterized protein n=1 Tax=Tetrahymena thermophila (strain SB210) TaxID=312017 RepID=I7MII0_TETTS|nr:hypothetical protein TTHERM_00616290 [Tetrahymena thermophila SB210]EAS04454.2 hypothetical protein TTHERM_00616290 [Tetrahymena thermophila SB210]|eukprot:XP_001024699.2 hypothetical protein TTHERM_00616290 [Tetrahymena thermophila SB210]